MRRPLLLILVCALLLPYGCKAPTTDSFSEMIGMEDTSKPLIERLNPAPSAEEAAAQDQASANATAEPVATIAIPDKALISQRLTIGVARNKDLEKYLNSVLEKLQASWPGEVVPSYVFVRPSPEFNSYAQDHAIFIDYGVLRALESEDELAALLGHEYSHILLGHEALGDLGQLLSITYGIYDIYNTANFHADGKAKGYLTKAAISYGADRMNQNAFIPIFDREQEEDADALGADLMLRAGYSPMGVVKLLNRQETWEAEKEKIKKKMEEEEAKLQAEQQGNDNATAVTNDLFASIGKAMNQMSQHHYPVKERRKTIKSYIRTYYPDIERSEPVTAPFAKVKKKKSVRLLFAGLNEMEKAKKAMYEEKPKTAWGLIRTASCRAQASNVSYIRSLDQQIAGKVGKLSAKRLEKDCNNPQTLLSEYQLLIAVNEKKDLDKALKIAKAAFKDLDSPRNMFPTLIRLNRKKGNSAEVLGYLAACRAAGDPGLSAMCNDSAATKKVEAKTTKKKH